MSTIHCIVCSYPVYAYKGHVFEMTYHGPWPLRIDGSPWRKSPTKAFWDAITEWESLPEDEKQKTRVGGGCVRV